MGFHFLKKSSKNIEMAPRGARSKLLIFDEALFCGEEDSFFRPPRGFPVKPGKYM